MNPKPLVTNNNNNKQQYCSGCENNFPSSSFTTNGKFYRTCNTCRLQNKAAYQRKLLYKQQNPDTNDDQIIIEFDDFHDFLADSFDNKENNENQENRENLEFKFSCIVNINTLEGNCNFKERASKIVSIITDVDEYTWVYHCKYESKKEKSETFYYYCSQKDCLKQKSNKDSNSNKHHDKRSMERFACKGCVKITIYENSTFSDIEIYHILHLARPNVTISPAVKQFILDNIDLLPREIYKRLVDRGLDINIWQKQIHFWWVELGKTRYKRDEDSFISAEKWLIEKSYQVIFQKENPKALGFLTELWNILQDSQFKIREIGVDATYNTNNLKFELYVVHAEVDGIGVPLAYLFIENNGNCGNGVRTGVIIDFLVQLKTRGLKPDFFITDKDFAQISAARFVWNGIKVQLCLWHVKKAIEARLANNKKPQQIIYNGIAAQQQFSFIDPLFSPSLTKEKIVFCPKEIRPLIWKMMNDHLHKHPLIPTIDGQFLSSASIWKMAVEEIYNFCKQNSLPWLWVYLWNEWYNADRWFLWFRAGCGDKLSIFKTNMFVEAHWKVLKRDFLYKFFRPRLDLVIFVIMEQVVPHNKRKFEQIFVGNVAIQFFDEVHRHYQYPFLNMLPIQIDNFRIFMTRFEDFEGDNMFEANNLQACEELYNRLVDTTEKVLEILKDQQSKRNLKWAKGIENNFKPLEKMLIFQLKFFLKRVQHLITSMYEI
ncbi:unnamed protein product [Rhizophagus irregularis]|nr:unnamed protein product [Rhizophagus irregularis]